MTQWEYSFYQMAQVLEMAITRPGPSMITPIILLQRLLYIQLYISATDMGFVNKLHKV